MLREFVLIYCGWIHISVFDKSAMPILKEVIKAHICSEKVTACVIPVILSVLMISVSHFTLTPGATVRFDFDRHAFLLAKSAKIQHRHGF